MRVFCALILTREASGKVHDLEGNRLSRCNFLKTPFETGKKMRNPPYPLGNPNTDGSADNKKGQLSYCQQE